jgi:hypothetical protein
MIVYLDQNKWIELARMFHGKDTSARARQVLKDYESATVEGRATLPLSSVHYIEMSRVSNVDRKVCLGTAMWHFSRGKTIIGYPAIVRHEFETALAKHVPRVKPGELKIVGKGHAHAFCAQLLQGLLKLFEEDVERSLLVGYEPYGIKPPAYSGTTHRENFRQSLSTIRERYDDMPSELRENWLYATSMIDILDPMNDVRRKHQLEEGLLEQLGEDGLKQVINDMPTRRVDLHLRRQVLRNRNYATRDSDLEDWGGVGVAACYCDVVICEKHMADMLHRDGFKTHARIEVALEDGLCHN